MQREENPEKFKSQSVNKFIYGLIAMQKLMWPRCRDLPSKIDIEVDGNQLRLPSSIEGVLVLNIWSWASGTVFVMIFVILAAQSLGEKKPRKMLHFFNMPTFSQVATHGAPAPMLASLLPRITTKSSR